MAALSSRLLLALWLLFTTAVSATLNTLTSSGRTRSYWVRSPDEYDEAKNYPVVIAFHGSSEIGYDVDGFAFEADIRLSLPAIPTKYSKDRFFVYPNGVGGVWAGPSYGKVSVAEDLQFVSDLIIDLKKQYKVDSSRIYATGLSNGGGFVSTLACASVGGLFAALAPVAGSFYTDVNGTNDGCKPARSPLPILEIHGGSDKSVYYNGGQGEGGLLPPIPVWLGFWQQRNGCTSNTTYNSDNGNVHHTVWTCKGISGTLQHWKVDKNGHDWPSKTMNIDMAVAGVGPQPIEANDIVIDFFDSFSLQG
ncbi:CAZyme family CE1 [Paecilomyces variotii]|nr:CAZyme family CE1 [Paecilomyces variotii]KAJ9324773.1 CAZyme family CE1 [Paecilomyces variotii]KAJ9335675.1 CAZyme family CE1 [Paecilomyces variotii]